jgi:hypothetical protein
MISATLHGQLIENLDDFEDGSTNGWFVGGPHPFPPATISTGGPEDVDDSYLRLTALGQQGPGGRLAVSSGPQWAGNYLAENITQIRMDVINFGPADLHLRLLFEDFDGMGPPLNLALSADAVFVPAGSGWQTVSFDVTPGALVPGVFGTVNGALMSADTLRLFHNPEPEFGGPGMGPPMVSVQLGIDNISTLTPVPEPGTYMAGVAVGFWCAVSWLRRRKSRVLVDPREPNVS